ncbi:MAG: ATP-binding cassette domain-containing protein [Bacteroidaceae bacterium]|nr:ATP-binding cassette domain-containing protein [Bacteroidaceae bacterium]
MLIELNNATISVAGKELLKDICFRIEESEFVYIIGKVGSGKSSLLKSLYAEIPIGSGDATVLDFNLRKIKKKQVPSLRRQLGIIFQDFQLLGDRTVESNLDFVLQATGWKKKQERQERISKVLEIVELSHKAGCFPHELSGGEQQRISIARALLNEPRIILADEPTGNLDQETGNKIVGILRSISERGTAIVMITHNLNILQQYPGVVYRCKDGHLTEVTSEYNNPIEIDEENPLQETLEVENETPETENNQEITTQE